jgi:hypothetical protein
LAFRDPHGPTFYQQHFATTHRHISKDLWPNASARDARERRALLDAFAFAEGAPVVVDKHEPDARRPREGADDGNLKTRRSVNDTSTARSSY